MQTFANFGSSLLLIHFELKPLVCYNDGGLGSGPASHSRQKFVDWSMFFGKLRIGASSIRLLDARSQNRISLYQLQHVWSLFDATLNAGVGALRAGLEV